MKADFSVDVLNSDSSKQIQDIFKKEGRLVSLMSNANNIDLTTITGAGTFIGNFQINPMKAYYIPSISYIGNKPLRFNIIKARRAVTGIGNLDSPNIQAYSGQTIESNEVFRGSIMGNWTNYIDRCDSAEKTGVFASMSAQNAYVIYDDFNFSAPNNILLTGDSVMDGSGATRKDLCFVWAIRKYFIDKGEDCRIINRAVPGSTSQFAEYERLNGLSDFTNVKLIIDNHGINDAGQNVNINTYRQNKIELINWADNIGAKLVLLTASPVENPTTQTAIQQYRDVVISLGQQYPSITVIDQGNVFTPTLRANYASTDPINNGIHPSDQAQLPLANNIINTFNSLDYSLLK